MTTSSTSDLTRRALERIRPDVRDMHAYVVQSAEGLLKLDAMENPYGLPPALQAELGARLGALAVNRYPGDEAQRLKTAIAAHVDLPAGQSLVLGNGSDELISLLAIACDQPGAAILAPMPGFVMYALSAQLQGLKFVGVPLDADFQLDEAAMLAAIAEHQPALLYLAYPNNPTANLFDAAVMRRLIAAQGEQGGMVVIDEAYQPFAAHSWLDEIRRDPAAHGHVVLMRTLSKFGLAGVRLGYLLAPEALATEIDKVRPPYNISVLNAECALFALAHAEVFEAQARAIRDERSRLMGALKALPGVTVWPSEANMVLLRVPDADAAFAGMKARGVLIKNVSRMHPLLANCLRLTVGTPDDNARMLAALQASL